VDTLSLGKHNPRLADIRRAINGETLTDDGLLPVEGPKLIREAQDSGLKIAAFFVRSDVSTENFIPNLQLLFWTSLLSEKFKRPNHRKD